MVSEISSTNGKSIILWKDMHFKAHFSHMPPKAFKKLEGHIFMTFNVYILRENNTSRFVFAYWEQNRSNISRISEAWTRSTF